MLALRVSTLRNAVKNAAITAITKAVAKIADTVRWVYIIDPPTPADHADRLANVPTMWGQSFEVAAADTGKPAKDQFGGTCAAN